MWLLNPFTRVPGPWALPVVGGMLQLRSDPLARVLELRARHGGFIRLGPLGRRNLYLVTEPAVVRHVLLDNHKNYKKGLNARRLRPILGSGSLLLEGETWRRRRRLVQPAFHKQKVATLGASFVEETDRMLERWTDGVTIDARDEMLRLTMSLTLRNLFASDASTLHALVDAWQTIYNSLGTRRLPWQRDERVTAALATVHRLLAARIAAAKVDDGTVLAMLVQARDEHGALTETELRDEVMTLFVGGYETSSNALAFSLANIAAHPRDAERQRAEIDRLGGRAPTVEDLAALPYTRAILEETLRLYPPSWMITREAIADDVITGFPVAAGAQLLISSYGVHHAPELWPEPEQFRPERFLDGVERPRFSYFPFGGGPRICLGEQYALTEMQLVLARIVQKRTLSLARGTQIAAHAQIGLRPRQPLRLVAQRRTEPN
jgi:cytochrome P450